MEGRPVFVKVEFTDGKLSITGVHGPMRNGNSYGSAGQIIMGFKEYDFRGYHTLADLVPEQSWDAAMIRKLFDVWDRWHCNDMKAGTPAQEAYLRANPVNDALNHYDKACQALTAAGLNPDNGYGYGSQWLREDVPADVLEWLQSLPATTRTPAWV
jgi:hypothetical protein